MSAPTAVGRTVTLADIVEKGGLFVDGDWVESKDQEPEGDVRLIQLADVGDGEYRDRSSRFLTGEKAEELRCTFLERGDLLIARMPDPLGRACIFPGDSKRAVTVVDVAVVRPRNPNVNDRWLMYHVNAPMFRRAVAALQSGSTRQRISRKNLASISFHLPERRVQDEAVGEIEKQFSRLDEAVANLQRVKANLKRYTATIFKAAVDGRLVSTEAELARTAGRGFELAAELLTRTVSARSSRWIGRGKYKEPLRADQLSATELPEGWTTATIDQLAFVDVGFAFKSDEFADEGVRLLRGENIEPGNLRWNETRCWPLDKLEPYRSLLLKEGEIILAMDRPVISTGLKLARVRRSDLPCLLVQRVARLRCVDREVEGYLHVAMSTDLFERHLVGEQTGTQLPHVSGSSIASFRVPLPPLAEQHRIVAEVDRRLSIVREVEAEVDANLKRARALRQAVLSKAFAPSGDV